MRQEYLIVSIIYSTNIIISGIIAWVKVLKVSMPTLGNESIFQKQRVIKLIEKKDS